MTKKEQAERMEELRRRGCEREFADMIVELEMQCDRLRAGNRRRPVKLAEGVVLVPPKLPTEEEAFVPVKAERSYLRDLTKTVSAFLAKLDQVMHEDPLGRGRRVARITNELEFANDRARHFGLGEPLTKKGTVRS